MLNFIRFHYNGNSTFNRRFEFMNQSNSVQSLFLQARQAYAGGDHSGCVSSCNKLLSLAGQKEEFLNLKAMSLLALGRVVAAEKNMRAALKLNSRSAGMQLNAARIYLVLADHRRAKRCALEAVRMDTSKAAVLFQAAVVCRDCGDYPQALRIIDRCLQRHEKLAEGWHLKGSMLVDMGDLEAAQQMLERAIALDPDHARAVSDLARIRGDGLDATGTLQQLERISTSSTSSRDRATALFSMASMHHRAGEAANAAEHYRLANAAATQSRPFNLDAWEGKQQAVLEHYRELTPVGAPGQGPGANLVFLVGMPRSGTSLCEQVLSAHSGTLACGELTAMHAIEKFADPAGNPEEARARYLDVLPPGHADRELISDKAPMNFERVGMIHELFPGARFLYCSRDPLDIIWSCYSQDFQSGVNWAFDLDAIARVYAAHVQVMRHWSERLPDHVHEVSYEAMVSDLETETRSLCRFLGISFEAAMLEPHHQKRTVATVSNLQVRQAVYQSSVGAWRNYADALAPAMARLRAEGLLETEPASSPD